MDELLKAIEELKRAYKSSGAKSVKVELGKDTIIQIDGLQRQLPITNGEWLRGLSDEEFIQKLNDGEIYISDALCGLICGGDCDCYKPSCHNCKLAWLRAEHKE